MRRITTNLTSGQISFILLIILATNALFFYFGLKYGGRLKNDTEHEISQQGLLPSDKLAQEVQEILAKGSTQFKFHDVLAQKQAISLDHSTTDIPKLDLAELAQKYQMADVNSLPAKKEDESNSENSKPVVQVKNGTDPIAEQKQIHGDQDKMTQDKTAAALNTKSDAQNKLKTPDSVTNQTSVPKDSVLKENKKNIVSDSKWDQPQEIVLEKEVKKMPNPSLDVVKKDEIQKKPEQIKPSLEDKKLEDDSESAMLQDPPKNAQGKYRLQMGSFSNRSDAIKALADWRKRGYSVKLVSSHVAGKGEWFRLQIGGYQSVDEVNKVQKKIMSEYNEPSTVSVAP